MSACEWIRFISGAALCVFGLFVTVTGVIGNFRFRFVLPRMHAAGLGDTLGLLAILSGVSVLSSSWLFALKCAALIIFFWIASPAASHMIMKMEIEKGSSADGKEEGK